MPKTLQNVREDILHVTRTMLAETSYNDLNMRAVASRCGIGIGTVYNYFQSKQEIVGAIIRSDWDIMLRRMEYGIKANKDCIQRLEIIYSELSSFMHGVHGIWFDNYSGELEKVDMHNVKCRKKGLIVELVEKVKAAIGDKVEKDKLDFTSDMIVRLFISYTYDGDVQFSTIQSFLQYVLQQ